MSRPQLLETWRSHLNSGETGLHLADSDHPLQIFIGSTDSGAPRMVLRTATKPTKPTLSNVVLVERYEDNGGKWNLSFTLQDRKFDEVFLRLADDLHDRSSTLPNERTALDRVGIVLDEWRRLLKPRPSGLLTMEELRGLVGELWLVLNEFSETRSVAAAIEGWLGPMGLPQDFWYEGDGYREAKAIGPSTTRVHISSEHQLNEDELDLMILRIANTGEDTLGSFNLPTQVSRIKSALSEIGAPSDPLDERLSRLGVNLTEPFYLDTWFVMIGGTEYDVRSEFPRIIATSLPTGVSRVTYQIELVDIEPFKQREIVVQ
jgi:Putative  PD-(D/E)XK family member, (DUF4420)